MKSVNAVHPNRLRTENRVLDRAYPINLLGIITILFFFSCITMVSGLTLVEEGEPRAAVVLSNEPTPVARHAAEELVRHVETATSVRLDLLSESELNDRYKHYVFVGETRAARNEGIDVAELPRDAFRMYISGHRLFVLGKENADDDPLARRAQTGTMYGVYELLQRYVGVRWLWPGELGTHVPRTETLKIEEPLDEVVEPAFRFRRMRWKHIKWASDDTYNQDLKRLAFTEEGVKSYAEDLELFLRRHRMGYSRPKPYVGHRFKGWWHKYGEDHPEWFMLRENGERGPPPGESTRPKHVPICVSESGLHDHLLNNVWNGGNNLRLGGVDKRRFCQCEECRSWDGPQNDPPSFAENLWQPQMVSDRYAKFWKTIARRAIKRNPDVYVTTYLYWNYLPAPREEITLPENVYGEFVPWGQSEIVYFPIKKKAYEWLKKQWTGWKDTGMTMAYRPNHFHGGYVMPHLSTEQAGSFFQFAYQHGMVGFDFDSLIGHWATKGPMFYMYMRLAEHPEQDIDSILDDYYSAFGPAAETVEAYFDYWEEYASDRPGGNLYNPIHAHRAYPEDVFERAESFLKKARNETRNAPRDVFARRVQFLQYGLEHARLARRFLAALDSGAVPEPGTKSFRQARRALKKLIAFRRKHEDLYIADYIDAAEREDRRIEIDTLLNE